MIFPSYHVTDTSQDKQLLYVASFKVRVQCKSQNFQILFIYSDCIVVEVFLLMLHVVLKWSLVILYFRIPILLQDYTKMSELNCSQVITHFGGHKFGCLFDVAIGPNQEVLVLDNTNHCVVVFDRELNPQTVIGQGEGESRLVHSTGLAVSKDSIIAVSDWGAICQVKKYSIQGKILSLLGGGNTTKNYCPKGLAFHNEALYVVDEGNCQVQVFHDDALSFVFGSKGTEQLYPGQFASPSRIAIGNNDMVVITDSDGGFINTFSLIGKFICRIACDRPMAVTISPDGYIIAGCDNAPNIKVWMPNYVLISQFGKIGNCKGEFHGIRGMALSSTGTIYVVEWNNQRLKIISNA